MQTGCESLSHIASELVTSSRSERHPMRRDCRPSLVGRFTLSAQNPRQATYICCGDAASISNCTAASWSVLARKPRVGVGDGRVAEATVILSVDRTIAELPLEVPPLCKHKPLFWYQKPRHAYQLRQWCSCTRLIRGWSTPFWPIFLGYPP